MRYKKNEKRWLCVHIIVLVGLNLKAFLIRKLTNEKNETTLMIQKLELEII